MSDAWRSWLPIYRPLILRSASENLIPPIQLAALIWQESNGGMRLVPGEGLVYHPRFLYRFEPAFWTKYLGPQSKSWPKYAPPPGAEEGLGLEMWKRRVSASYGIAQVMYSTACEITELPPDHLEPEELLNPAWCLDIGSRHLARSLAKGESWRGALAAYNTGRAGDDGGHTQYDDEVIAKESALAAGGALEILEG